MMKDLNKSLVLTVFLIFGVVYFGYTSYQLSFKLDAIESIAMEVQKHSTEKDFAKSVTAFSICLVLALLIIGVLSTKKNDEDEY